MTNSILIIFLLLIFIILILYYKSLLTILINEYLYPIKSRKDIREKQKSLLSKLLITDLSNYPIMTKKDLSVRKNGYITAYTSGTSGQMVSISHNYETFVKTQIITGSRIFKDHLGLFTFGMKIVFLISTGETLTNFLASKTSLPISLLSNITVISFDDPISNIINKLNKIKPDILVSYPTFLEELITYDTRIKPSIIVTISESLTPVIRLKLEDKFLMSKIIETYGCTECPFLAVSCPDGVLHLQEDIVFLEPIDKYNKVLPLEVGTTSDKILITNLINTYQPLIRYQLEDSIEIIDCVCGSPFQAIKVHGRSDDIFYLIDSHGNTKRVLPISIESSIFLDLPLISYQMIHVKQNFLLILYIANQDCYIPLKNKLDKFLSRNELTNVSYKIERKEKIERGKNGKIRQIISKVSPN